MNGIVLVDKPAGITSHDAVQWVRRLLDARKAGHTGTLDPLATGLLTVCVGEATKLAPFLAEDEKEYEVTLRLGVRTDTQDVTGRLLETAEPRVTEEAFAAVLAEFRGIIRQTVPRYSAVKVRGRPLHRWARKGVDVEPPDRQVEIRDIAAGEFRPPLAHFRVTCSKGTYVRTLCADIGDRLGCGAALEALRRTRSGRFRIENAVPLAGDDAAARLRERIVPMAEALSELPAVTAPEPYATRISQGWQPEGEALRAMQIPSLAAGDVLKFLTGSGRLLALGRLRVAAGEIVGTRHEQPMRMLRIFHDTEP